MEDIRAETVAKFIIQKIVLVFGAPINILTDQGVQFTSALMQNFLHAMSTTHVRTSAYHPQTNSLVENFNKTLTSMLSMYCNTDQKNWDEALPYVTFAFNSSIQESTRSSPHRLLFGREPRLPIDILLRAPVSCVFTQDFALNVEDARFLASENVKDIQLKNKFHYDLKRSDKQFKIGDEVLVYTPVRKVGKSEKLLHRFYGPFTIVEQKSPVNFRVENKESKRREIVHISRLKIFRNEVDENIDDPTEQGTRKPEMSNRYSRIESIEEIGDQSELIDESMDETPQKHLKPITISRGAGRPKKKVSFDLGLDGLINCAEEETCSSEKQTTHEQKKGRFGRKISPPKRLTY